MSGGPAAAVLRGERPTRLPVAPVVGGDHAAWRAGVRLKDAMSDADRLADVLLSAHKAYESDVVLVFSDVTVEAEALGAGVAWPDDSPPRVETCPGAGALRALDPEREGRLPVILGAVRRVTAEVGGDALVLASLKGPFSLAALVIGLEELLESAVLEPDGARAALRVATECQLGYAKAIVAAGGVPLIGEPFASGSVLGPDHFEDLVLPGLTRLVDEIHDLGSPAAIHICGDVDPVLDHLLDAKADLLHLEHADLAKAAASGAALMGGIPTEALLAEDDEELLAAVREAKAAIPDRDRFILATVCDVPTRATPERVSLLMREARSEP